MADWFFDGHGPKAVFIGRWLPVLRVYASWLAGGARMRWRSFAFWNAFGGITWAVSIGLFGYFVGSSATAILHKLGVFGIFVVLLGIVGIVTMIRRQRRRFTLATEGQAAAASGGQVAAASGGEVAIAAGGQTAVASAADTIAESLVTPTVEPPV